jgi:hypothetical protein
MKIIDWEGHLSFQGFGREFSRAIALITPWTSKLDMLAWTTHGCSEKEQQKERETTSFGGFWNGVSAVEA